jgi:ribosome assembly protein RRB1
VRSEGAFRKFFMSSSKNLKRPSSPSKLSSPSNKSNQPPHQNNRAPNTDHNEIGEFEDDWEDEFEEEEFIQNSDEEDQELNDAADKMNLDTVPEDEDEESKPPLLTHLPHHSLPEGQSVLKPDLSAYPLLHSMSLKWPALSFDFLRDDKGMERRKFPMECCVVAGTQAEEGSGEDEVVIMRWEGLSRTNKRGERLNGSNDLSGTTLHDEK